MKKLLVLFPLLVNSVNAQLNWVEASTNQVIQGTAGAPYVITPRRLGPWIPGAGTSITSNITGGGGSSNNVWATIVGGGHLINSNGVRIFTFDAEPWINTNYLKIGDPLSGADPFVILGTARGAQFVNSASFPTNVEANAFNSPQSTNSIGLYLGDRLAPAVVSRIAPTATGLAVQNAVGANTNLAVRNLTASGTVEAASTIQTAGATMFLSPGVSIAAMLRQGVGITMGSTTPFKHADNADPNAGTPDVGIARVSAGLYEVNNGTVGTRRLLAAAAYFDNYVATDTSFTLTSTNSVVNFTATGQTLTFPTAVGIVGRRYTIKLSGAGTLTLATISAQTIDGTTPVALTTGQSRTFQSDGANWWIIGGYL